MRIILLPLALFLTAIVSAQEARPVQCRFLGFGGDSGAVEMIALGSKDVEIKCPVPLSNLSPRVTCFVTGESLPFFTAEGRKPAAIATIPAGMKSALLVFIPGSTSAASKGGMPWRVFVIDDSLKNFPDGGAFIANFHDNDIRFIIGEHKGMLHSAAFHGYAHPNNRDSFNMAPVIFEVLQEEKWRVANESSLRFLPGIRYLIFAFTDPVSGRPRISTCQDFTQQVVVEPAKP